MTTIKSLLESGVITMETQVLGTLPMTKDGCIAGRDADLWTIMLAQWKQYVWASENPAPIDYDPRCDSEELYSSKEAALAAQEPA